jgi:hypothetical protein
MIGNIQDSFINMIDQSTWMDSNSKNMAKDKVNIYIYVIDKKKKQNISIIG